MTGHPERRRNLIEYMSQIVADYMHDARIDWDEDDVRLYGEHEEAEKQMQRILKEL